MTVNASADGTVSASSARSNVTARRLPETAGGVASSRVGAREGERVSATVANFPLTQSSETSVQAQE